MLNVFKIDVFKTIKKNRDEINSTLQYFPSDLKLEPFNSKFESKNVIYNKFEEMIGEDFEKILNNLKIIQRKYCFNQKLDDNQNHIENINLLKINNLSTQNRKLSKSVSLLENTMEENTQLLAEVLKLNMQKDEEIRLLSEKINLYEGKSKKTISSSKNIDIEDIKAAKELKQAEVDSIENKKITELKELLSDKEDETIFLKEKIQKLEEKYKKLKESFKSLKQEIEKITEKNDLKKTQYIEKIEVLSLKIKKLKKSKLATKEENLLLKNQLEDKKLAKSKKRDSLKQQLSSEMNETSKSKKPDMQYDYDIVVNIDSLTKKPGWDVQINNNYLDIDKEFSVVGLVGRENIGKTFLLNKLCGFDLPSGANVNTKGLSLKYSISSNLICMDSAGMQTPVYYYDEKLLTSYSVLKEQLYDNDDVKLQMINNRTLTDAFIQDFILEVSEVIVIVIGQLSQNDQKIIERISRKYREKKRIIIIHNFSNLYNVEDIEKKIQKDIIKAFNPFERKIPGTNLIEFIEKSPKISNENISHLVLGAEGHESGETYNELTLKYITDIMDTRINKRQFNLIEELTKFMENNYRLYFNFRKRPDKGVSLIYDEKSKMIKIKSDENYEISNPIFNSLGTLITNPPYEVFEKSDKYVCLIELPNLEKKQLEFKIERKKSEYNLLIIQGYKNYSPLSEEKNERIWGNRKCGEFSVIIPLGLNHIPVRIEENWKYKSGILIVIVIIIQEQSEII